MTQFRQEKKCWHEHQKFHMFEKLVVETLDLVEKTFVLRTVCSTKKKG